MDSTKQIVKEVLSHLPDDCTLEDVQYHLYVAETIRNRRDLLARGETCNQSQAESRLERWLIK